MVMMLPTALHSSHAGYDSQDINFGRFFKAATQTGKRLLKEVFLMMLYRSHVSSNVWPTTVAKYCFSVLSWSNRKYRDGFNAEERALLEQPVSSTDFDISLLFKMIHKLFSSMNLPESFWRAIQDLKKVRNRVCHERVVLDQMQLSETFDDLKMIFENLLKEAADFFSADTNDLREVFLHEAEEILASPVTADAYEYFEKVKEFRAYLLGKFIMYGRRELMVLYPKLKTLNPFTWLSDEHFQEMQVDKIFTPLYITQQDRCVNVFSLLTTVCAHQETTGILPSVLVLSGIAGCGKTSLCRYFLHDWTTGSGKIASLRSVDIVIHIEVRNVTCSKLLSYLQRILLQETCRCFREKDIIETLQQINVLYIIDGMDEAMDDSIQLVNEVLSLLGNSRVMITARPACTSTIIQAAQRYHLSHMKLDIQGFSSDGITKFTSQVFSSLKPEEEDHHQQECEFLSFLKKAGGLGDHLKLPLTLVLLISLWREDRSRLSRVTSITRLYFEIFRMCAMKMISRLQTNTSLNQMVLEAFVEEWLLALGKEAYSMLKNGEYVISENRSKILMSLCTARQIDSIQVFSTFLMCEVRANFKGVQYLFSFIHKSQMEYLAAKYLAHKIALEACSRPQKVPSLVQELTMEEHPTIRGTIMYLTSPDTIMLRSMLYKWCNTLNFVIGQLCINKCSNSIIREVMETILGSRTRSYDIPGLWQIVQESDCHPTVCEMAGDAVYDEFVWRPIDESLCNPSDATFQLLQHTNFTPKRVVIRILGCDREVAIRRGTGRVERKAYETLVPLLACLSHRPSARVELRVEQHFYDWGSPATTDDLLTTLLPAGNLTSLMGHVGVKGAAALAKVREVSGAYVRISDPMALRVLSDSLLASGGKINQLTLRLDIPSAFPLASLPTFSQTPELSIVLKDVDDQRASWAAKVLARLSSSYKEVDFVASRLTPSGGERLLEILREERVAIAERLTIRSVHRLQETSYQRMAEIIPCLFAWWY